MDLDVNAQRGRGHTLLNAACKFGLIDLEIKLLARGADPDIRSEYGTWSNEFCIETEAYAKKDVDTKAQALSVLQHWRDVRDNIQRSFKNLVQNEKFKSNSVA